MRIIVALCLVSVAAPAGLSGEPAALSIPFDSRPSEAELEPRNDDERHASIVLLNYQIEFSGFIPAWLGKATTGKRHRARYLIRDYRGVEAIKQHTFFGDESNVTVGEVRGQTISPDGSVHPVDPEKDIRELDIEVGRRNKDLLRTVNFPRVEPGAVLDLEWMATADRMPTLETIELYPAFPTREFRVKSQGKLTGRPDSSSGFGFGNQTYWVPFIISRAPAGTVARLSSLMDLELTATDLPAYAREPFAPPAIRTGALLGLVTKLYPARKWRENLYLFDARQELAEQEKLEVVWTTGSMDGNEPLVEFDELALQAVPLTGRNARADAMRFYQQALKQITREYQRFAKGTKTGESPAQLEEIAPSSMDWNERIDRIFRYARDRVRLDPDGRNWGRLDRLIEKGSGDGEAFRNYFKYLLDQAGVENDFVMVFGRRDLPLITVFEYWWFAFKSRSLVVEARGPDGAVRYLEPSDVLADSRSFSDYYLGGVLFRDSGHPRTDWTIERIPISASVRERTVLDFSADAASAPDGEQILSVRAETHGSAANRMRWSLGRRTPDADADELSKRRMAFLRGWLDGWAGTSLPEDFSMEITEPDSQIWEPYSLAADMPWSGAVQQLGDRLLLPAFPEASLFQNPFVAEQRRHPLWLRGGDFDISMTWKLPPGMQPAQMQQSESTGPGGLHFRLNQEWDAGRSLLTSRFQMRQPYLLPATAYPEVRKLFQQMQQATAMSLLIEHRL